MLRMPKSRLLYRALYDVELLAEWVLPAGVVTITLLSILSGYLLKPGKPARILLFTPRSALDVCSRCNMRSAACRS